jgi:hypothetical protein
MERLEKFHPRLENKRVLFVDKSMFTPRFVNHMTGLEKMKVTPRDNMLQIPDLNDYMERNHLDFAIIHNASLGEAETIIAAVQKGKVVVVQEKDSSLELNLKFNQLLQKSGVKTFSRTEPDVEKAFRKCLDYLATCVK